jgi:hypothetical protein
MRDLHEFTAVYVNPKLRKMRMEAYAVVAPYPVQFPRIKNACIKWAWKQTPNKGWCQLPPSISHRLSGSSKHGMHYFMVDLEAAMLDLSKFVSTVAEDLKSKTKWIAEVEINLMSKFFAVPKSEDGKTVQMQQDELCEQCAALIATKLLDLAGHPGFKGNIKAIPRKPSKLMARVQEHVSNPDFQTTGKKKQQESVVT